MLCSILHVSSNFLSNPPPENYQGISHQLICHRWLEDVWAFGPPVRWWFPGRVVVPFLIYFLFLHICSFFVHACTTIFLNAIVTLPGQGTYTGRRPLLLPRRYPCQDVRPPLHQRDACPGAVVLGRVHHPGPRAAQPILTIPLAAVLFASRL